MPDLFRNKYFVWAVVVAFSVFALSAKTARADFGDLVQFFISSVFAFILAAVITFFCVPCGAALTPELAATLNGLFGFSLFSFSISSLISTTLVTITGTALCLSGIGFGSCAGRSPDIYYIGTTAPLNLNFPPPTMAASSTYLGPNCSVNLSWSVLNITYYGIYRATGDSTSTLLYQSDTCIPRNGTSTPFVINYTDTSTAPATTYTYNLVVEDIDAQLFKFPNQVVTTPPTCQ